MERCIAAYSRSSPASQPLPKPYLLFQIVDTRNVARPFALEDTNILVCQSLPHGHHVLAPLGHMFIVRRELAFNVRVFALLCRAKAYFRS